jgi:hypothetical protein
MQIMNFPMSYDTQKNYVCAHCWGNVVASPSTEHPGMYEVECTDPDCTGEGFISRKTVERREAESLGQFVEARSTLEAAGVIVNEHKGKSEQQLLAEMGF